MSALGVTMERPVPPPNAAMLAARREAAVLLVDDEPGIRTALTAHFLREGWQVFAASGVRDAERRLAGRVFDLVVTDVRMPDGDGAELMRTVQRLSPETPVVLLTAYGTVPDAVEAMRGGAADYLTKPVAWNQLRAAAERLMTRRDHSDQGNNAEPACVTADAPATMHGGIVGQSPALLRAIGRARAAASTDADVLVEAESGCGKELLARFIHDASSRARKPFVAVNCAAVPEHLLESELFGHARGAFTGATQAKPGKFEIADGGTLLLDEIGEMPLHLQPKLLRALQEREFERLGETRSVRVDIRVIATTNVSLAKAVERGAFRSDLYYRLNVIPLSLPTLRERLEDIPLLARYFADHWAAQNRRSAPVLTPGFLERLAAHPWPGNVRELGNFLRRVLALHGGREGAPVLDEACFQKEEPTRFATNAVSIQAVGDTAAPAAIAPMGLSIREMERRALESTLAMTQGNRTHAAEMLGISIRTMRNKIREYGLPPRRYA